MKSMKTVPFDQRFGFQEGFREPSARRAQRVSSAISDRIPGAPEPLYRPRQLFLGDPGEEIARPAQPAHFERFAQRGWRPFEGFSGALHSSFASEPLLVSAKLWQRLIELQDLRAGWDGESAKPPRPEVLARIFGLLGVMKGSAPGFREPFLAPTIHGFAQLEWHRERRTLEFEATANGWAMVGTETTARGEKVYHDAEAGGSEIGKLIAAYRWFAGEELLWPVL
jgi:hypothetical protein